MMGPVERELRERIDWSSWGGRWFFSPEAMSVVIGARDSLRFKYPNSSFNEWATVWPDIASEAIEAAEALGL